jgi:hypothetical protein
MKFCRCSELKNRRAILIAYVKSQPKRKRAIIIHGRSASVSGNENHVGVDKKMRGQAD